MTKVKITGRDDAGRGSEVERWVDAPPEKAAEHPDVLQTYNALKKRYKDVKIEIIK